MLQQALDLIRVLGDRVGEAYVLNGLGSAGLLLRELESAEVYFSQSIEVCGQVNERNAHAHAALGLGRVYAERQEYDLAEQFAIRAVREFAAQENIPLHTEALELVRALRQAAGRLGFSSLAPLTLDD